ncbi:MAG: DNA mismatch repair endonuclease MutL, partial [Elusimicrobiaceae bacterium]|nr:DNA mismatch repair endonuclease MutL [Elusimicrobiaceae bacterium]
MSNIHVLDEQTAGQIAAGEVIERPAGVLKELLENAIDAGATAVHIDIEGAGRTLIRVNDNGRGMDAADLKLSVLRHATSKISRFDDLDSLNTFGFRGEALYSVAAVSKMVLTSCPQGGQGNRLEVSGGKVTNFCPAPAVAGTTVEIRDLFYNVPARQKFLKSDSYERACLLKVIEESALANVQVGYHVRINGRDVYHMPAQQTDFEQAVLVRARQIMGQEVADTLLCKQFKEMGLVLFISPADKLVRVRDLQYIFVNRRPIDSKTVQQALYKAYQNARQPNYFPVFIVYMTLPPDQFDVNIHPQKRDVRFADEHAVFGTLLHAAGQTIFSNGKPLEVTVQTPPSVALPAQAQPATQKLFTSAPAVAKRPAAPSEFALKTPAAQLRDSEEPVPYISQPVSSSAPANVPQEVALPQDEPAWYQGPYHYLGQLQ